MTPPCRVVRPKVSPPPRPMTTRIELHCDRRDGAVHQDDSLVFAQPPTRSRPSPVCTLACFPPGLPTSHQKSTFACLHPCKACFPPQCLPTSPPLLPPDTSARSRPSPVCTQGCLLEPPQTGLLATKDTY